MTAALDFIESKTFNELSVGDHAQLSRPLGPDDIKLFASISGDINPVHLDVEFASHDPFRGIVAQGMWGGALISAYWAPNCRDLARSMSAKRSPSAGQSCPATPLRRLCASRRSALTRSVSFSTA